MTSKSEQGASADERDARADDLPQKHETDGASPSVWRQHIPDERDRDRPQSRLAGTDEHPQQEEHAESANETTQPGAEAPRDQTEEKDVAPTEAVCREAEREARKRVEQGEGQPLQEAHLRVGNTEVGLDGIDDEIDHQPIHRTEAGYYENHEECPPRDRRRRPGAAGIWRVQ